MTINSEFLYYLVDKYVKGAANGIRVQDGSTTVVTLTEVTCSSSSITGGGQVSCSDVDTSSNSYYFDRAYLLRSSYTIDGVTKDEVGYITTTRTLKDGSQVLTVTITTKITAG